MTFPSTHSVRTGAPPAAGKVPPPFPVVLELMVTVEALTTSPGWVTLTQVQLEVNPVAEKTSL